MCLLNGQSNQVFNGIWVANTAGAWTYPADFQSGTLAGKAYVLVTGGTNFAGSSWVCNTPTATIGTDPISFVEFSLPNATTGANVGIGTGQIFQGKSGQTLDFRTLLDGSYITITTGTNEVTIAANGTSLNVANDLVARDGAGNASLGTLTAATGVNVTTGGVTVSAGGATISGNVNLTLQSALRLQDAGGTGDYVGIQAPVSVPTSYTVSLPSVPPTAGQVLQATSPTATQWATVGGLPANAQTYYVSKSGNDSNNGSFAAPFLTVAHAVSVANALPASLANPIVIYIGAGIYSETAIPMTISVPGISIVGSSMSSTTIMPSPVSTTPLFNISTPNVNFYNFTMDSGSSTPSAGNAVTYNVSSSGEAGFHSLGINGFAIGLSLTGSTSPLVLCDALQAQGNGVSIAVNNVHTIIENSVFVGPYTGSTVSNTGITIDGSQTSGTLVNVLNNSFTLLATGVGVSQTISGSNMRMLGCNIDNTNVGVNCTGACTATIVGCDFILNTPTSVNIQATGTGTNITINGCNFDGATTGGVAQGIGIAVTTGAEVLADSCTIENMFIGLGCGTSGDTITTQLKANSTILNGNTNDIAQTGTSTLSFVGGMFNASLINIGNPANVTFAAFDASASDALSIGNSTDTTQTLFEVFNGETSKPSMIYQSNYYGNKGPVYTNANAGDSALTGVQSNSNNAYHYLVTGSRTAQTGINLISDTANIGLTDSVRGWAITKLGTTNAPLAFSFSNNDLSGLANIPSYTLMQLDGAASQVAITASGASIVPALSVMASPTGTAGSAGASITSNSSAPALLLAGQSTTTAPALRMTGVPAAASGNFVLAIDNAGNVTQTAITDTIIGNAIVNGGQTGPLTVGTTNATSLTLVTGGANNSRLSISPTGTTTVTGNLVVSPAAAQTGLSITGNGAAAAASLISSASAPALLLAGQSTTTAPALRMTGVPAAASNNFILAIDNSGNVTQTAITDTTLGNVIVNGGQSGPLTIGTTNATSLAFITNNNPVLSISSGGTTTITGQTNINTTGSAGIELGTGGTGPVSIGNTTGNTVVTGSLTINPAAAQTGLSITGNGAAPAASLISSAAAPALLLAGQSTTTAPALRMTGVPAAASNNFILAIDNSGNVTQTAITDNTLGNFIVNGGQTGPLTIGTTNQTIMTFETNSTAAMTINSSGQIGIGTEPTGLAPYTQLVVPGSVPTATNGTGSGTGVQPESVYVQGRYAYVVSRNSSTPLLQIFDVSNPSAPQLMNVAGTPTGSNPNSVYVQGSYAYVVNEGASTLQIFDITNPVTPALVGQANAGTGGSANGVPVRVYVQGKYAYVVNNAASTLQLFDVSNPTVPTSVGSVATGTGPSCVYVQGKYAYVTSQTSNLLQIFDVSNQAGPALVGSIATGGGSGAPIAVYVQGRYAYVANVGTSTLQLFDISNPLSPQPAGSVATGGSPQYVYAQGRYAYVVNAAASTLQVFDVSNPASPTSVASAITGGGAASPNCVYVQGRYAYVTNFNTPLLQLFDLGGAYIQQLEAGGIEVGTLATRENLAVNNDLMVFGGSTFGRGFDSTGPSSVTASGSYASSATASGWQPALTVQGQLYVPASIPPAALSTSTAGTTPSSVYVQGRYAYIVNFGTNLLYIFDVSNPASPTLVSNSAATGAGSQVVSVQGRYAYVISQNANLLQVYDVSNPAAPVQVSTVTTGSGSTPQGLYVQGKYAYVANNGSSTLQIFDISNPTITPTLISSITTGGGSGGANAVYVQGKFAYVTNGVTATLQIFDVSNPAAPTSINGNGTSTGSTSPIGVYVQGRYAYVTNNGSTGTNGLQIFDVSTPSAPIIAGSAQTGTNPHGVYVQGRYAYVGNQGSNTLQVIDVSTPTAPVSVGTVGGTGTSLTNVYVQGRYLYIVGSNLQIFDLGGAYIQQLEAGGIEVGTLQTRENMTVNNDLAVVGGATFGRGFDSTGPSSVTASGSYASSATASGWQPALTVQGQLYVPASLPPAAVGIATTGSAPNSVYMQGRYAYVVNGTSNTLQIIDVSNPSSPQVMNGTPGTATAFTTPFTVYTQGRYAYVACSGGLQIFDVFNPTTPVSVGTVSTTSIQGLYVQDKYAYVPLTNGTLQIYDVSNPQVPTLVGSISVGSQLVEVYVQGKYAYVLDHGTLLLEIYDVSNPSVPSLTGTVSIGQPVRGIYVQGRYAYIGSQSNTGSFQIVDISNPASPTVVSGSSLNIGNGLNGIYVQGRYAYATNGTTGNTSIQVIDVTRPSAPVVVGTMLTAAGLTPFRIFIQGRYAYLVNSGSTGVNGFQVFDLGGAYIQQLEAGGIEVGTLATRENMTVNNDLAVVGGATFGRGFDSTGPSSVTASGSYASSVTASGWQPALTVQGQLYVPDSIPPAAVGSATTGNGPVALYVQGRYAYVVNNSSGTLQIFDVSNPSSPVQVSNSVATGTGPAWVYVQGRYAYVLNKTAATFQVFDVSNPTTIPAALSSIATASLPEQVYVQGHYAYVSVFNGSALQIFDVSNPVVPALVGSVTTNGGIVGVYVQGKYAYVTANANNRLQIIDVSNPAAPVIMNGLGAPTNNNPWGVYVQGSYAYVVNSGSGGGSGLQIFNINDPTTTAAPVGSGTTGSAPFGVYVQGRNAYVTNVTGNTLQVFDVTNPASVVPSIGSVTTAGSGPLGLSVQGRYAYVANSTSTGANGLQIFDLGGAYIQQLEAGGIEVGTLQTRENMTVNNDLAVVGGATFGRGFDSTGPSSVTASGSYASSVTASGWQPALTVQGQLYVPASAPPAAVGSVGITASANSIYVQGRYAYVLSIAASGNFQIIDISNPSAPQVIGTSATISTGRFIYVQGRYAYVTSQGSGQLQVYDVSNPALPTLVGTGSVSIPLGLYVQGKYAYVVQQGSGLLVFDVSNPASPVQVGSLTSGLAAVTYAIYVQGIYAYIACRNNSPGGTLQIVDVSNPAAPVLRSSATTGADPLGVYVQGRYAYVVNDGAPSLQIFDISNPLVTPALVGATTTGGNGVYVQGRYAYVSNEGTLANIYDVTNPASPVLVGTFTTASGNEGIFVQGRYAYVPCGTANVLQVFDLGGAYIQQLEAGGIEVGTLATRENMTVNNDLAVVGGATFGRGFDSTGPSSVTASGSYAGVSATASGWQPALTVQGQLYVPASLPPAAIGSATTGGATTGLYVQGKYAYVTNENSGSTNGLQIFDVSNPSSPVLINTLNTPTGTNPISVYVQGRYAYVVNNNGGSTGSLQIFDVSNPASPVLINTVGTATGSSPQSIYVQGKYVYVVNGATPTLQIFDISNPVSPVLVSGTGTGAGGYVYVQGRYAYLATTNGLQIFDVSNPALPVSMNGTGTGTGALGTVYVQGSYAYASHASTLQVFNISNPTSPTLVGTATGVTNASFIYVQGRYAYVTNNSTNSFQVIDVSTPSNPIVVGTVPTTSDADSIWVQGRYVYVTEFTGGGNGLQIFDLGGAYIQQLEAGGIEVGTLQTRENMTVNNDLAVVGGATFGRGFDSTGPSSVTASGSYASSVTASGWQPALTVQGQLYVPDSIPPAAVGTLGSPSLATNLQTVYVQGRYAYVINNTTNAGTLQIIDVSNVNAPQLMSTFTFAGNQNPLDVYVQGRYAYVALNGGTMQIFDVSNPGVTPVLVSTTTAAGAIGIYVQGRYAYVVGNAANSQLEIFDVSNPASPVQVGTLTTLGSSPASRNIYVQGRYAYMDNYNTTDAFIIVDVSNPTAPVVVNGAGLSIPSCYALKVQGRYAYVIGSNGLNIVDVSNPASPSIVSTLGIGGTAQEVFVQGRYVYTTGPGNVVNIIDVTYPSAPVLVGTITTGSTPFGIFVQGRYIYITNNSSGTLQIFDLGGAYIQQLEAGGIEVGTLATRENMTVNNDLDVRGGATFARGFDATGNSSIDGQLFIPPVVPTTTIGSATTGNVPEGIYVQGRYAYVVNNSTNSLQIFDVSTPSNPQLMNTTPTSTGNNPRYIYVQGRYAYVVTNTGNQLQIFDVSNPVSPVLMSSTIVAGGAGGGPTGVYVQGRYAYVVNNGSNQLQIFDVSNPVAPVAANGNGTSTGTGSPIFVYVQGRYAYLVNFGSSTLQIFDVSNPAVPVATNGSGTSTGGGSGAPASVVVQGRYAYLVNRATGTLQIFDISNPAVPVATNGNGTATGGGASGQLPDCVYVQGRYAYVLNEGGSTLETFDVSNPALPVSIGTVGTATNPFNMFVQGRYAYIVNQGVSAGALGLQVYDLGGAYIQQLEAGGIETGTLQTRENMTVNNDLAVAGGATFARGFDATGNSDIYGQLFIPPVTPTAATGFISATAPIGLYVQGRYAYVVNSSSTGPLQIFDVSNPSSIGSAIGSATTGNSPIRVYVQGRYAYVVNQTSNSLQVFDVSDPAAPTVVGTATTGTNPTGVYVQDKYAYVINQTPSLQAFDVSNPAAPVLAGSIAISLSGTSLYVQGRYAYILTPNLLQVFDVSNPTSIPAAVGSVTTNATSNAVYVQGSYAYIVSGNGISGSLQIFNISNPASIPVPVGAIALGGPATGIYVQGRYAYITNSGLSTLQLVDVTSPSSPTLLLGVSTGSQPAGVFVQGRYVYVVNTSGATLQAFDFGGAYIQQFEAGGIEVGTLQTRENLTVNNDLDVRGGATFARGIASSGPVSIVGVSSSITSTPLTLINLPIANNTALTVNANGQVSIATSSGRFKENIRSLDEQAEKMYALNPVKFDYKKEHGGAKNQLGLIAEEVEKYLPELVVYQDDGKPYSLAYQMLIPLLVKEIQKHKNNIEQQAAESQEQKKTIEEQKKTLACLIEQVARLVARMENN